jgi:2-polyprenyl-3-methyl-5-hydroxy-6-metoxy-1,4-benzoquinol methylase
MECLLCGSRRHRRVFEEQGVDIVRCSECDHVFSSYPGDPHYEGFWGDEVTEGEHPYWSTARAGMYEEFARRFVVGRRGRLLDMGCGLGFFLKEMTKYPAWESHGCEISPAAVRHARERLKVPNVQCTRLADADLAEASFDVITMWDVLDHILAPDPVLARCHALLTDGGLCFIRTPNIAMHLPRARVKKALLGVRPGVAYLQARDHMHHYSAASIRRLLARNGFAEIEFVHLRPVASLHHRDSVMARAMREVWFQTVRGLDALSGGRLNYDNLFVVARKALGARSRSAS